MIESWGAYLGAACGTVLVLAGASKALGGESVLPFLLALGTPSRLAEPLARATWPAEVGLGALLLSGWLALPAVAGALALAVAFATLQTVARARAVGEECRCFGQLDADAPAAVSLGRAVGLAVATASLLGLVVASGGSPLDPAPRPAGWTWAGVATGVAYVVAIALAGQVAGFEDRRPRAVRRNRVARRPGGRMGTTEPREVAMSETGGRR